MNFYDVIAKNYSDLTHYEKILADHLTAEPPEYTEYTGAVPVTFTADGNDLNDWTIYGNTGGVGDRTANLFSTNWIPGIINSSGNYEASNVAVCTNDYISIEYDNTYSFSRDIKSGYIQLRFYDVNKQYVGGGTSNIQLLVGSSTSNPMSENVGFCVFKIVNSNIAYMKINDTTNSTATKYMMCEGEYTAQTMPSYEPYGMYKIPIICGGETTDIYIDSPLGLNETISKTDTGVNIPTVAGSNTLSVNTTVQPEKIYIKYKEG